MGVFRPSIEDPHNAIHGALGGVMASYQVSSPRAFPLRNDDDVSVGL